MKVLVLFLVSGVAHCATAQESESPEEKPPRWANEPKFSRFQEAWTSIEIGSLRYYLTNATYNNDSVWGEGFKCVSVTEKSKNLDNKSTEVEIRYMNKDHQTLQTSHEKVWAIYMYNYKNTTNGIRYEVQDKENVTFEDALVFSYGESCDIFYAPYAVNAVGRTVGGYELWVSEEKVDNIAPCCLFMYQYLAGKRRTYQIYTEDCKKKTVATESPAVST